MTPDELRDELLGYISAMVNYWASQPGMSAVDQCEGAAFSILAALDGEAGGVGSSYDLTSRVHPDDEDQSREGLVISDTLHEHFMSLRRKGH